MDSSTEYVMPVTATESHRLLADAFGDRGSSAKLREVVDRLLHLVDSFESFSGQQLVEMDHRVREQEAASAVETSNVPEDFAQSMKLFMAQRSQWEEERQGQVERIQQDSVELEKAWQALEAEQRALMSERATGDKLRDSRAAVSRAAETIETKESRDPVSEYVNAPPVKRSTEAMMLQYEQLRREVRKHAKRRN